MKQVSALAYINKPPQMPPDFAWRQYVAQLLEVAFKRSA
jgi:hypothetical protein